MSNTIRYVYVAGPYTQGDPAKNVRNAVAAADELVAAGFVPFVPHLCHLWHLIAPAGYEKWMEWDLAWLNRCDALLRLPGLSPGADREEAFMRALGRPVFYSLEALQEYIAREVNP